ncbi:MAG: enoyl-CoA hydratase/isomerase family protein [Betaproteobacteria bacterium]|nr:enoyl-CoA hydratase/isomerase family protein [Betaproteobacteria bacterium]
MKPAGAVHCTVQGTTARVTLANAGRHNALTAAMWRALREGFTALASQAQLRCIVIAGEGEHFAAGGDIAEFATFRFDRAALQAFHDDTVAPALDALWACDVPVIAAIRGSCIGGGLEIASQCDLRLASADARFGVPIGRLGMPMAPGEVQAVARAGWAPVLRELLIGGAVLDAAQAQARGLVQEVASADALDSAVAAAQARIEAMSPQALRLSKRTLRAWHTGRLQAEWASLFDYADSAEHREGIQAFIDKRTPRF